MDRKRPRRAVRFGPEPASREHEGKEPQSGFHALEARPVRAETAAREAGQYE
jgi:hypothetical protein